MRACPNCSADMYASRRDLAGAVFAYCSVCDWNEETNVVLSDEEALAELFAAAEHALNFVHRSDESFAVDAMYRTRADQLREQADHLERRDAAIGRLQRAVAVVKSRAE